MTVPGEPPGSDPVASEPAEAARADLADRLGVEPDTIEAGALERVTWRDGSLGCPDPDRSYTQALVDGYRIELRVDGTSYWYHGADGGDPFYCADPADPAPAGAGDR